MLENNVFFLGFITTLEIYILCDILFFGKIILKGFIKQGFVITSLIFALAYKADMSTISGAFILLTCLGVFINKGISDYSFTDLFRTIDEGADEYVRLKVSGGLNDLNEP